jgi:hypothetical protein
LLISITFIILRIFDLKVLRNLFIYCHLSLEVNTTLPIKPRQRTYVSTKP